MSDGECKHLVFSLLARPLLTTVQVFRVKCLNGSLPPCTHGWREVGLFLSVYGRSGGEGGGSLPPCV